MATIAEERVKTLKKEIVYKTVRAGVVYRPEVKICLERAQLWTESFQQTDGEPMVVRRAKALAKVLENMTIYIKDKELIVGNFAGTPDSLALFPEISYNWVARGIGLRDDYELEKQEKGIEKKAGTETTKFKTMVTEEYMEGLSRIFKYWKGKSVEDRVMKILPDDIKAYVYTPAAQVTLWRMGFGLTIPNYEKLFKVGLNGIIKEVNEKQEELKRSLGGRDVSHYAKQRDFLEAALITLKAAITYSNRYSEKAKELAQQESDAVRKRELEEIAEVCHWVLGNPPRTFREALQFFIFIHYIISYIEYQGQGCGLRFDQVFYPFYKTDIEEGRYTQEQELEFIQCAWIKMDEAGGLRPPGLLEGGAGNNQNQTIMIGGVTREGNDGSNELTRLAMEATLRVRTLQPLLSLRYHDKLPSDVLYKAMDLLKTGHGMPSFFNDKAIIPHIMSRHGVSLEDARDYGIVACVAWSIPGKNMMATSPQIGFHSAGKFLELALNRGIDPNDGKQLGYPTPDPSRFKSINDVMDAYVGQAGFFAEKISKIDKIANTLNSQYIQRPFLSTLLDDCIERGEDCTSWAFYHYPTTVPVGLINVADSMAAMKKCVFDEKAISLEDLIRACHVNFEGKEELRRRLIKAPKYGNDDDYVDLFAREVHLRHNKEFMKQTNYLGCPYYLNGSVVTEHFTQGLGTGALPDGRLAGKPFADGTLSPMVGLDTKGPTAVLQSVSKVDPMGSFAQLLNQRFMPQYLEGDNKKLFAAYLKTWSDLGIWHIQFNVVDSNVLRDAQKHPGRYQDLVVRVAGFSAHFTDLSTTVQDEIIARTEQRF